MCHAVFQQPEQLAWRELPDPQRHAGLKRGYSRWRQVAMIWTAGIWTAGGSWQLDVPGCPLDPLSRRCAASITMRPLVCNSSTVEDL